MGSSLPLRGIAVFEAAARLGSFRAAAAELNLTPSAVSHQIRQLEQRLATTLFERVGRGVSLTAHGGDYARVVCSSFERLRQATEEAGRHSRRARELDLVRVRTPPSLASRWLLPRLPAFMAEYPHINLRVTAQTGRLAGAPADIAIVYARRGEAQPGSLPLIREVLQPLCAPMLLRGCRLEDPADLLTQSLIRTSGNALSWEDWFHANHVAVDLSSFRPIQLDPSHMAIDASVRGLGFVFESDVLTLEDRMSGRLVTPFPGRGLAITSYWLLPLHPPGNRSAVDATLRWLQAQGGLLDQPTDPPPAPSAMA